MKLSPLFFSAVVLVSAGAYRAHKEEQILESIELSLKTKGYNDNDAKCVVANIQSSRGILDYVYMSEERIEAIAKKSASACRISFKLGHGPE